MPEKNWENGTKKWMAAPVSSLQVHAKKNPIVFLRLLLISIKLLYIAVMIPTSWSHSPVMVDAHIVCRCRYRLARQYDDHGEIQTRPTGAACSAQCSAFLLHRGFISPVPIPTTTAPSFLPQPSIAAQALRRPPRTSSPGILHRNRTSDPLSPSSTCLPACRSTSSSTSNRDLSVGAPSIDSFRRAESRHHCRGP